MEIFKFIHVCQYVIQSKDVIIYVSKHLNTDSYYQIDTFSEPYKSGNESRINQTYNGLKYTYLSLKHHYN